jgi:hydroxycarboxylate dehydrogenase B
MPRLDPQTLSRFTASIFQACDIPGDVAREVADSLVLANLSGHDSHGIIRIMEYVNWTRRGLVNPHGQLTVEREQPCILILDGDFGFGQVIGRRAMELGIAKAQAEGACILSLKRSGHLGRIGEFMEQAAEAGLVCFAFTNTHGAGVLVAPYGGCERRLSANPVAGGAPRPDGPPLLMDISTSTIAEGKIKVARSKGESLPSGMIVNGAGEPSTSPEEYYADPPGALLPMAGHKGFALSMFCEVLAGALTGAGCSRAGVERVANGFMAFLLDPATFSGHDFVSRQLGDLSQWVTSSRLQSGFDQIQLPGEPEARARVTRESQGIDIDETTWRKIGEIAAECRVPMPSTSASGT